MALHVIRHFIKKTDRIFICYTLSYLAKPSYNSESHFALYFILHWKFMERAVMQSLIKSLLTTKKTSSYCKNMNAVFLFKRGRYLFLGLFLALVAGCDDNTKVIDPQGKNKQHAAMGYWLAPAYGQVMAITSLDENTQNNYLYRVYHVTNETCVPGDSEVFSYNELSAYLFGENFTQHLTLIEPGQTITPGIQFERTDQLPSICNQENLSVVKGDAGYSFNPELDFEIFWNSFNQYYVDFSLSDTDWNEIYQDAIPELDEIESEEDLFELFSLMITPLHDAHNNLAIGTINNGDEDDFSVSYKPDYVEILLDEFLTIEDLEELQTQEQAQAANQYIQSQLDIYNETILAYAKEETAEEAADNDFTWFITNENIGYLSISSMANFLDSDSDLKDDIQVLTQILNRALTALKDVNGLIIDVRMNGGGHDEISMLIAQRFMANSGHVYSKQARLGNDRTPLLNVYLEPASDNQYLGPIVVLTSASTASAAEVFALAMGSFVNVSIMGESTQGAFSDVLTSRVTSDIVFGLSNEYYLSTTGQWFEHIGIPVEPQIPFLTSEQREQKRDYALEEALKHLTQ